MSQYREFTPISLNQPTPEDLIYGCSDYRFQKAYDQILANRGINRPDVIKRPGSSHKIVHSDGLEDISDLVGLHGVTKFHLLDHMPCGKFMNEGEYTLDAGEEEMLKVHLNKTEAAISIVHDALPHLVVCRYVVDSERVVFEEERYKAHVYASQSAQ